MEAFCIYSIAFFSLLLFLLCKGICDILLVLQVHCEEKTISANLFPSVASFNLRLCRLKHETELFVCICSGYSRAAFIPGSFWCYHVVCRRLCTENSLGHESVVAFR